MHKTIFYLTFCWILWVTTAVSSISAQDLQARGFQLKWFGNPFEVTIRPLLEDHCAGCHDPGSMPGLDFLSAKTEDDLTAVRGIYVAVIEQMLNHKMPPGDDISLTEADRKQVTDWLTNHLQVKPAEFDRIAQYVVEIYQAKDGDLWLGTVNDGVARFDGQSLKYFTTKDGLPSNTVISVVEDKDGTVWIGTHDGIARFNGTTFTKVDSTLGLPPGEGNLFIDNQGELWANLNQGIYRWDGRAFSEFKLPIDKKNILSYAIVPGRASVRLQDRQGNLWISTDGYGALKYDGKSFQRISTGNGLCSNVVNDILEDKEGNIWFACMQSFQTETTGDGGLIRYDGSRFTPFPDIKGLSKNDIYSIFETKSGDLWIGATGVGAYRYDGKTFTLFDKTDRPQWTRNFGVQDITEDQNGKLWFGFSGGLFQFNGKSFQNVSQAELKAYFQEKPTPESSKSEPLEPVPVLTQPKSWATEQIPFPLGFAPSIKFTGYEDIRFAPGWANTNSPEFWTYKFVWLIEEDPKLDQEQIARMLETYFDGLSRSVSANGNGAKQNLQEPVAIFVEDGNQWRGRIRVFDAFASQDWISLNVKVSQTKLQQRNVIQFEFSPQAFDHKVWADLESIGIESDH